jgi:Uma2 family endonuclease
VDQIEEIRATLKNLSMMDRVSVYEWLRDVVIEEDRHGWPPYAGYGGEYGVGEAAPPIYDAEQDADLEPQVMSFEEYLEFEKTSPIRHEYIAGRAFAMTGASRPHNKITGNLFAAFHSHLRGSPCEPFSSDMKVKIETAGDRLSYYPDVVVACDPASSDEDFLTEPTLIVEVLSPSTESVDRREKLHHYRKIPTLQEYVLLTQRIPRVTIYRRDEDWRVHQLKSLEEQAEFRSIQLLLPLARIYEGVL